MGSDDSNEKICNLFPVGEFVEEKRERVDATCVCV